MSTRLRSRSDRHTRRSRRFHSIASISSGPRAKFAFLLGTIGVLFLVGPLAGKVGDVEDNGPTAQLPRGAESTRVEEELPSFDADGVVSATVVYVRDGGLTAADRDAVATARTELAAYAADGRVSPSRFSDDGEAASLAFGIDTLADGDRTRFEEIRAIVDDQAPDGLDATVTGPAATRYDVIGAFDGVDGRILGASVLVVALLLLLIYRSPVLWLVPLVSIGVAMMLAEVAIYLLGKHAGLPVDGQSGGILPILVFGVGTDYALLLIARYREELHRQSDRHAAMRQAIRRAGPAILASSATVVLGLSCLMLADINSTRSLGAVCAIGVGFAAIAMLTVLPMVLTLLGRWVFWPFVPRVDPDAATDDDTSRWHGAWSRIAAVVARSPRTVWRLTAVGLAVLALSTIGLNIGTTDEQKFATTPDSVTGQRILSQHFPAGSSAPAEVLADAATATDVRAAIADVDGVERVSSPQPSTDGSRVRFEAVLTDASDSPEAEATVEALRHKLDDIGASDAVVGGPTAEAMDLATAASRDAWLVIPFVLIVVVLVLMALLRSVVGPLVLLGTVLLSYAAALGAGGLLMRAMGFDAVDVSLPLLAFVFLVALGVDYTIFLMSRVREEVGHVGHRLGVARGLIATGGVITSAGLVLAATFSVLAVMPIVFMIGLGVVVALGVLLDTFVVRSLLVPALALDIGDRFWSPSRSR
ncbi:MAG TPA: MMPL family transporter [Nocardioidaceae bacterium]|nr:MMPL family transporter [Nocardioidaceae bacterium]